MGFFDNIFDLFSAEPGENAAAAQAQGFRKAQGSANASMDKGIGALKKYTGKANDFLAPMSAQYNELFDYGGGSRDMFANGMGLNGQEGYDSAVNAFQTSPGSEYVLDESLNAVMRRAANLGQTTDRGTLLALNDYSRNHFANEQWNPWMDRLSATGAQYSQVDPTPQSMAQNMVGLGQGIAGQQQGKANIAYNANIGIGDANAQRQLAGSYAGANALNAIIGGASAAAKAFGGVA